MSHNRARGRARRTVVAAAVGALALAGCGSSGSSKATGTKTPAKHGSASTSTSAPGVQTATFSPASTSGLSTSPPPWPLPANAGVMILDAGLAPEGQETLTYHYHAHLDIVVNGSAVAVPPGVGFVIKNGQASGVSSLHTHDATGVIHIESPTNKPYELGQFFTEWGVSLGPGRLGGLADGGGNVLKVFVNGKQFSGNPADLVLKAHQEIALWYGPASQTPQVPSHYSFPSGE